MYVGWFAIEHEVPDYANKISATVDQLFNETFTNVLEDFPTRTFNFLRAIYHGIRLDLGIIRPNQIFNSPTRFNASIHRLLHTYSAVNVRSRRDAVGNVDLSTPPANQRVPKILYLTSVFTPKRLGQAIAAVFVATFSMITALWHIVNFIASSLVTARSEKGQNYSCLII